MAVGTALGAAALPLVATSTASLWATSELSSGEGGAEEGGGGLGQSPGSLQAPASDRASVALATHAAKRLEDGPNSAMAFV